MKNGERSVSLVSVIVPVYNEYEVLTSFYVRLTESVEKSDEEFEFIFVDDGSLDASPLALKLLCDRDERCSSICLSRNFGKEVAMTVGLDYASGDAVVIIDADLQDPPELIPQMIECWKDGGDVVYARRQSRCGESWLKKFTAHAFYRLMRWISDVDIPADTGDFRLLSRRSVDAIKSLPERHRFMKGLFSWVGFEQRAIDYERDARAAGQSKWNYWQLWNFALEGITSHTTMPLKISSYLGGTVALLSFVLAVVVIVKKLVFGDPVAGYPSLMVAVLFFGGIQLMSLGVIGEYLARTFDEVKQRPLYLIASCVGPISSRVNENGSHLPEGKVRVG
jgi:polyisoprenyl-phosphate glycosyltransferase